MPFEIPENWCWTTLGELFDIVSAKRVLQSDWQRTGIPFYRAREIVRLSYEGYVDNDLFITEEHYNNLKKSYGVPEPSDIMLSAVGTIGRAYVVRNNDVFYYKDASVLCLRNVYHLNSEFIKWILSSDLMQNQMYENSKGTTVDTITIEKANSYFLPLPPIDEQYRIVKLLCEWDAYINDINKNKEEILNNIRTCKSKILDLAISGKLVPQDPNDEPAIELLKRINPNFQPCDNSHYENLPQGWAFCKIKDIFNITMGQSPTGESINGVKGIEFHQGKIHFTESYLSQSSVYTDQPTKIVEVDSLLLCVRAPVGVLNITQRKICIGRGLCALKPKYEIDNLYWLFILSAYKDYFESNATGSTFKAISGDTIKNAVIKLPPLQEQERILYSIISLYESLDAITAEL